MELRIELIDPADRPSAGGRIVAAGTPDVMAAVEASHTGKYLRTRLVVSQREGRTAGKKGGKG
ncbi:MAG: hypothetical protein WBL87_08170 [Methanothrix sp.]